MFELKKSETIPLTRKAVEEFRRLEASPTERELDPRRLKWIRDKADRGELVNFQWAIAQLGKAKIRVNGQHSSAMLADLPDELWPAGLMIHLDTYAVEEMADVVALFRQFDARRSSRSSADIAGAYQGLEGDLGDIPRSEGKLAIDGVYWHRRNVQGLPPARTDEQYELFHLTELHPFVRWVSALVDVKTPELRRAPVVAAMFATWEADRERAADFWHSTARGGNETDPTGATQALSNFLVASMGNARRDLKPAQFYQGCVSAWNAFVAREPLQRVMASTAKGFLPVLGSASGVEERPARRRGGKGGREQREAAE